MTKRVKLLSVMVAAVLCFVAGFAIMFGSNKTASAAEVPVVEAPAASNTYVANGGLDFKSTVPTDSEWIFTEMTLSAKTTATRHATDSNGFISTLSNDGTVSHESSAGVYNGILHNSEPLGVESFKLLFSANGEEKQIKIAVNTVTGEMTTIVNGDVAHATSAVKYGSAASLTGTDRYFGFTTNSASVNGVIKNLVMYDGEGKDLVATSTKMTKAANVELPATAVRPSVGANYSNGGSISYAIQNTRPASDNYIIFEYVVEASTTSTAPQNGLFTKVSNGSQEVSVLHAFASNPSVGTLTGKFFNVSASADTPVKVVVNTATGDLAICKDDVWTIYAGMYNLSSLSNPAYYIIQSNGNKIDGTLKNLVCYDGQGNDLGITTNLSKAPVLPTTAVKPSDGASYEAAGGYEIKNARPAGDNYIIFEYVVPAATTYTSVQNGLFTKVSNGSQEASVLHSFQTNPNVHTVTGAFFKNDSKDVHVKVVVNTATGELAVCKDGVWTLWEGMYNVSSLSNPAYFIIKSNGNAINGVIKDLVCYDGQGNDLGITTSLAKLLILPETAVKPETSGRYYANDGLRISTVEPTTAPYIIVEYTLKAGISMTSGSAPQNGMISTVSTTGVHTNEDTVGSVDGMLYGFGTNPAVSTAFQWFTAASDTTVKMVIESATGDIYLSKNGGAYSLYSTHAGVANFTEETRYFSIGTNTQPGSGITGWIEDIVAYDSNGVDLGVKTTSGLSKVVEGKVVDIVDSLGCNNADGGRYIGHIYFKDINGEDVPGFYLGSVPALKYGEEATTLNFSPIEGAYQLFAPAQNGVPGQSEVDWKWEEQYVNEWYVVEAGTIVGGKVILAEDMIIRMHGSSMQLFNASYEFAINYEGMDGKENPNTTTTRKFDEAVTIAAIDDPLFNGWDVTEIPAYTVGDVTVTANWVEAQWLDYNLTISEDLSLSFNVRNVGSVSLTAIFTMDIDEDTAITETVSMDHYDNEVPGKIIFVNFTFDKILPQHLGDNINVKIMYGDIQMLEMDVTVKDYLDEKIADENVGEVEKALAQDLLYYGAAAQLYTGHDVENLPADLDGVSVDLPDDLSVYAKEGEKDAEYYWKKAEVVYDNTVSLVLTFAAPADLDKLVVNVLNAGVETDCVATQVSAGIYEVSIALPATQFGNTLTLTIKDNGVAMGQVLTYSVYSYIAEVETVDTAYITLLERLYCYGAAANKFANLDA